MSRLFAVERFQVEEGTLELPGWGSLFGLTAGETSDGCDVHFLYRKDSGGKDCDWDTVQSGFVCSIGNSAVHTLPWFVCVIIIISIVLGLRMLVEMRTHNEIQCSMAHQ